MGNTQFNERNISMVMDMYELTMSNGYFNKGSQDTVVAFDVFYRKNPDNAGFSIFAGGYPRLALSGKAGSHHRLGVLGGQLRTARTDDRHG